MFLLKALRIPTKDVYSLHVHEKFRDLKDLLLETYNVEYDHHAIELNYCFYQFYEYFQKEKCFLICINGVAEVH